MFSKDKLVIFLDILKSGDCKRISNFFSSTYSFYAEPDSPSNSPLIVQIEPTTFCNLKCVMCISPDMQRDRTHLTLERFKILLERLKYVEKINLVGIGEPLLNPYLPDIIKTAKKRGIKIGIATNGLLLKKSMADLLIDSGIDWINISLDGMRYETYKKIRMVDKYTFDKLIDNIKDFQRLVKKINRPFDTGIWFTIQRANIYELPEMIAFVKSLGFNKLYSQVTHTWGHRDNAIEKGYMFNGALSELLDIIIKTKRLAVKNGIEYYPYNIPLYDSMRKCKWPWRSCYISVEGFVTPCCMNGSDPDVINFGNIFNEDFENIWKSEGYSDFRKRLKSPFQPHICHSCPSY